MLDGQVLYSRAEHLPLGSDQKLRANFEQARDMGLAGRVAVIEALNFETRDGAFMNCVIFGGR